MAESIRFACPQCKTAYRLTPETTPGAKVRCAKCGGEFVVPEAVQPPEAPGPPSLAGSPDDREVTLRPARSDDSTLSQGRPDDEPSVAKATGRYVEQGVIGRGGMGEIVLCVERNTRRQVAMKRMLAATAEDPGRRARFVEEAQVTAQLEHPNIVPVHELDRSADGTIYFTMKLVKGRSLADIRRDLKNPPGGSGASGTVTLGELLQIFLKVCDGVAFAHSRGVVHRDLKPSNIMVGDFGEVLVMDWGLAKIVGREDIRAGDLVTSSRLGSDIAHTMAGSAIGTPAYMSPEQANGELDKIDHRSDIYSLGAILYEMLTLERPVEGDTPLIVLVNAAEGNIVPPEQRAPTRHVPRELSAVVMKCLHKNRLRRYQSVSELQKDVGLFIEGRSVGAAPDTFTQAVVKLLKRNKGVSAAVAAAAVLLIAVTTAFIIRLASERDRAVASERRALDNEKEAIAARDKQRATALAASKRQAESAVRAASEGRLDEAKARADAAVEVMPDGPWGHYALGVIAHEKKDFASARKHLDEALRLDPAHGPSKLLHATVLAATGDLAKWEQLAAEADKCTDWKALVAAGDALFATDRYAQSVRAYQRAVALAEREHALPAATKDRIRDKLAKAIACLKMVGFYESIRELPSDEQQKRLAAKIEEAYAARVLYHIGGVVVEKGRRLSVVLYTAGDKVRWLDPLRGIPLTELNITTTAVRDLGPLRGMPLTVLLVSRPVRDLSPLAGMPLAQFSCHRCPVNDLAPLKGMPLRWLNCGETPVKDLSPLAGMRLTYLNIGNTGVVDLSPLKGIPLETLFMQQLPVTSLAPLKGMPLAILNCETCRVTDLTPLQGMPLSYLNLQRNPVADIRPISGAPLKQLWLNQTQVRDLTPLAGMKLVEFWPPAKKQLTPESLKVVEELEKQGCKIVWQK